MNLTDRKIEALTMALLVNNPHFYYHGSPSASSRAGGAATRMVEELINNGFVPRRWGDDGQSITLKGLDALLENIERVPEFAAGKAMRDLVRTTAPAVREKLAELEEKKRVEAERLAAQSAERVAKAAARRRENIKVRIQELTAAHNLRPLMLDSPSNRDFGDVLVEFWEAIVNSDAGM